MPQHYFWSSDTSRSGHEADITLSIIPGLGALANSHLGLVNVQATSLSVGSAGYHRSKDVGVGAFSDRYNLNFEATENIPAGMELFVNYGSDYFSARENKMGPMPMMPDYFESEDILEDFWKHLDLDTSGNKNATESYAKLMDSITKPKVKMVMPKTFEEAESVRGAKAAILNVPNVIKSQDWLDDNGMCLDNIYPGDSKVPQAGRGAFASRKINNGQLISPMPLMHMNKNVFRVLNDEREIGTQLMLNYVFGHEKSSLVMLPYSPTVNFVNNHADKSKVNARMQWSMNKYHNKSWEVESVEYILGQDNAGLMLELMAITDIEKDEEIYIDYGAKWDEAWADHVQNWKAPPRSHEYMSVEVLNDEEEIKTEKERVEEPLGYNVVTLCWLDTGALVHDVTDGVKDLKWKDYRIDIMSEVANHQTTADCFVEARYQSDGESGTTRTLYQIYLVGGTKGGNEKKKVFVDDVPREAICFMNKPYTSDQHIESAFRHTIHIPDDMFPRKWMDLDRK